MSRHNAIPSIIFTMWVFLIFPILFLSFPCHAETAKQAYLAADNCYKTLRHSAVKRQKAHEWIRCIHQYENIYKNYPSSAWAPAGMYKAAQMYLILSRLSGETQYKLEAKDLLVRIQNRYPESAYTGRAKSLQRKNLLTAKASSSGKIKHLKSKKRLTKNEELIRAFIKDRKDQTVFIPEQAPEKTEIEKKPTEEKKATQPPPENTPQSDTVVSELRFWSNPEYTRIVVNADAERDYFHRLLKKDPDINKPFQRLYVDIEQAKLGKGVAEHTPINDDLLKQARAGQYLPHTVRVVVDIKSFENYKIFSLKDPFRIVIDVWGKGSNGSPATIADASDKSGNSKTKPSPIPPGKLKTPDIARQLALGVRTIVIDPGHGGADPGAPGYYKGTWEKDIVLSMSKQLAAVLRDRLKCTVFLTRSSDRKLPLEERTAIANTKRADLFISMHCNASKNRKLRGIETYILNLTTDNQAIAVAARENATSEKNISDLEYILNDLMKNTKIHESTRLAHDVHKSMISGIRKKYPDVPDLGVKQAPFYVLIGARMPSILIESSFISNKTECKRLKSAAYQKRLCDSIADGVEKYIEATNPKQLQ